MVQQKIPAPIVLPSQTDLAASLITDQQFMVPSVCPSSSGVCQSSSVETSKKEPKKATTKRKNIDLNAVEGHKDEEIATNIIGDDSEQICSTEKI